MRRFVRSRDDRVSAIQSTYAAAAVPNPDDPFRRDALEAAIIDLEQLLNSSACEEKFQRYFEDRPAALAALGYKRVVPRPRLPIAAGGHYVPDFLVEPHSRLPELLDIKTPDERVLIDRPRRAKFTAALESYISQLHDYREYFNEAAHREACRRLTGLDVPMSPRMVIVAGRDAGLDKLVLHAQLQRRGDALAILTYDDVRAELEREHTSRYGAAEDLAGISIFTVVRFQRGVPGRRRYFLDTGHAESSSRCSIYLDEGDSLTFEVTGREGAPLAAKTVEGDRFAFDRFYLATFEYGASDDRTILQLRLDDEIIADQRAIRRVGVSPSLPLSPDTMTIGADVAGRHNAAFDLAELCVYSRILRFDERIDLALYFAEKYFPDRLGNGPTANGERSR
jgi:hypothetical protein